MTEQLWYTSEPRTISIHTTCITCGKKRSPQMSRAIFCRKDEVDEWVVIGWECLRHDEEHGPRWPSFPDAKQFNCVPRSVKWGYQNKTPLSGICENCERHIGMGETYRAEMVFDGRRWKAELVLCYKCGKVEERDPTTWWTPYIGKKEE